MDRILKPLTALVKPWQGPYWLLLVIIGLNRLIVNVTFNVKSETNFQWSQIVPRFGTEILTALFIAAFFAVCVLGMLKIFNKPGAKAAFSELFKMCLKAQSAYMMAAPLALLALAFGPSLHYEWNKTLGQLVNGLLSLGTFAFLFVLLRRRFENKMGELSIVGLLFSAHIFMVAFVFLALLALLICAAIAVVALLWR